MLQKILGVIAGLVTGVLVIAVVQAVGHSLYPLPAGLDLADKAALAEVLRQAPIGALLWVALSWLFGTAAGTFLAQRIARRGRSEDSEKWPALTVEAFLLAAGILNLLGLPHPVWFWIVGLASFPVGAFTGIRLARR